MRTRILERTGAKDESETGAPQFGPGKVCGKRDGDNLA